jgi:hypothetical protein
MHASTALIRLKDYRNKRVLNMSKTLILLVESTSYLACSTIAILFPKMLNFQKKHFVGKKNSEGK